MIKLHDIPTNEQLLKLANSINEEFKNIKKDNFYIVFELDKNLLRQIDEEYYFKNNTDSSQNNFIPSDEVEIIVSDVRFKFINKEDGIEKEEK